MEFEHVLFWLLAFGAVVSSLMVVFPPGGRNPLYGALALIVSFFFMAGIYVLLVAHLMAVLQILVYAGAIMVLFMFVIMLLNLSRGELAEQSRHPIQWLGLIGMGVIAALTIVIVRKSADAVASGDTTLPDDFGTVGQMGEILFRENLFPFELASILLLVAVIGAVVLAKRTL